MALGEESTWMTSLASHNVRNGELKNRRADLVNFFPD
jgi:hypothetical protein